jgi:hypothetical protein
VDQDFRALAVIVWEGASTMPWEVVHIETPLFLAELPTVMHKLHSVVDKDDNTARPLSERDKYINAVEQRERDLEIDQTLSKFLRNSDVQNPAYGIKVYHEPGKLGLYCELLRPFDTEMAN